MRTANPSQTEEEASNPEAAGTERPEAVIENGGLGLERVRALHCSLVGPQRCQPCTAKKRALVTWEGPLLLGIFVVHVAAF